MTDWVRSLARHLGIASDYRGFGGERVTVSAETLHAVMAAMGHPVASQSEARDRLRELRAAAAAHPARPEVILRAGRRASLAVTRPVDWTLEAEGTGAPLASGRAETAMRLPPLAMGVHRLVLRAGAQHWQTWVFARPARAVALSDRTGRARAWGVTTALYGLTDGGRVPIGDYARLGAYGAALARHGADFIGINPVHAMGRTRPDDVVSPYSPSHRGFLNTWHAGTGEAAPAAAGELIDYGAALAANARALQAGFARFRALPAEAEERHAFAAFTAGAGPALDDFALFEVLADAHGPDWRSWPTAFRDRDTAALGAVRRDRREAIDFVKWAQWEADRQLAAAQERVRAAGMGVGLYLDLAVGPRPGGAESWAEGSALVTGATLGAPPDPLSPAGQSWGLAPLSPQASRAEGHAGFARLLRAVMRHAGMIRIDHVIGLMRAYWIPEGGREGTYVSYPLDALLAVVAIEGARSGTIVIGEDLGLVPEGLRETLDAHGIYGMEVLQFLRDPAGGFADPATLRRRALCAFATHDTPTIAGYLAAEDARLQAGLGMLSAAGFERIRADRARAQAALGPGPAAEEIHRRLAAARSELVAVQLEDIAGRKEQQNLPGTVEGHPNWRRAAPFSIAQIESAPEFARLGREMARAGRTNARKTENGHDLPDCSNIAH
ncbi:4-alpha-glucanotransferase [Albidovulum sp.]